MQTVTRTTNKKALKINGTNYVKITPLAMHNLPEEFELPVTGTPHIMHVKFTKSSRTFTVRTMAEKVCLLVERLTMQQFMGLLQK